MKKRKLPFGYRMEQGQVCIDQDEAKLVNRIFEGYIAGMSYNQLANDLNNQSVPYNGQDSRWNKNIVARLLQNQAYIGERGYPPIITKEMFKSAETVSGNKRIETSPDCRPMRSLVSCAVCGEKMEYLRDGNWRCPQYTGTILRMPDETLRKGIYVLLEQVRNNPAKISAPGKDVANNEVIKLGTDLEQELNKDEFNEDAAKVLVFMLAAAQFEAIGSEDYETIRIQHILADAERRREVDINLMQQITSAILIHPDSSISLKLKNGQIFGRSIIP